MIDTLPDSVRCGGSYVMPCCVSGAGRVEGKLGDDSSPLPLATKSFLPSVATADGYQPVGTNPTTRDASLLAMSATITSLLSALATNSDLPSGDTATAHGVDPSGLEAYRLVERISSALAGGGALALVL